MQKIHKCRVEYTTFLTKDVVKVVMESNEIAETAVPGQFLNIKCGSDGSLILRRPISINKVSRERGTVSIVFRIVGSGTKLLSSVDRGDVLDVLGPLGNGFDLNVDDNDKIAIIAGGMGVMPMLYLAKELKEFNTDVFLGYKNINEVMLETEYRKYCNNSYIATDDGSKGYRGTITDLFKKHLMLNKYDRIYACGPKPMFLSLKKIADKEKVGVNCQVSLEEHMGCGVGACLVCSCKIKTESEEGFDYKRVCKDGPVFNLKEVIFE